MIMITSRGASNCTFIDEQVLGGIGGRQRGGNRRQGARHTGKRRRIQAHRGETSPCKHKLDLQENEREFGRGTSCGAIGEKDLLVRRGATGRSLLGNFPP